MTSSAQVSQLLQAWGAGDAAAREQLIPLVYDDLRRVARRHLRVERAGHSLQTAALINEAYLRLVDQQVPWQNRAHFFGIAARLMRQILVDHARERGRHKRGGARQQISLTAAGDVAEEQAAEILALDDALQSLAELDPQQSRIVELRFFGGLTIEETAEVCQLSTATIEREWRSARAWLRQTLSKG